MTKYYLYYCGMTPCERSFYDWCSEEEFSERMQDENIVRVEKLNLEDGVMFKFYNDHGRWEGGIQITK